MCFGSKPKTQTSTNSNEGTFNNTAGSTFNTLTDSNSSSTARNESTGNQTSQGFSSSSVQLPDWMTGQFRGIADQSQALGQQGFQAYNGPLTQGFNGTQQQAANNAASLSNFQAPTAQGANIYGYLPNGTSAAGGNMQQYLDPYNEQVVQAAQRDIDRGTQIERRRQSGNAAMSGAFGGDRAAIADQELLRNSRDQSARTSATLRSQNYQQALSAAAADQGRALQAAGSQAGFDQSTNQANQQAQFQAQQARLQGNQQLFGIGQAEQATGQAGIDANYNEFMRQINDPYQKLQYQATVTGGIAPLFATQVAQNTGSQSTNQVGNQTASQTGNVTGSGNQDSTSSGSSTGSATATGPAQGSGGGFGSGLLQIAGGVAGAYFGGPAGAAIGSQVGGSLGRAGGGLIGMADGGLFPGEGGEEFGDGEGSGGEPLHLPESPAIRQILAMIAGMDPREFEDQPEPGMEEMAFAEGGEVPTEEELYPVAAPPGNESPTALIPVPARSNLERRVSLESGGNPRAQNPNSGATGLEQFMPVRVQQLGFYTPGPQESREQNRWSGQFRIPGFENVRTIQDFQNSPEAQRAVGTMHSQVQEEEARTEGLDRFLGRQIGGTPLTRDDIRNAMHFAGPTGARRWLESNGQANPNDGTLDVTSYVNRLRGGGAGGIRGSAPPPQQQAATPVAAPEGDEQMVPTSGEAPQGREPLTGWQSFGEGMRGRGALGHLPMSLIQSGLRTIASRNPSAIGATAEGGIAGLQYYQNAQNIDANTESTRQLNDIRRIQAEAALRRAGGQQRTGRVMTPEEVQANGQDPDRVIGVWSATGTPSFNATPDEEIRRRQAGVPPTPPVPVTESAADRPWGTALGEAAVRYQGSLNNGLQEIGTLNRMEENLNRFTTGIGSGARIAIGDVARQIGVPTSTLERLGIDPRAIAAGETLRADAGKMILEQLRSGEFPSQGFSNADRDFLQRINPAITNTQEGNRALLAVRRLSAERSMRIGREWATFREANAGVPISQTVERFQRDVLPRILGRQDASEAQRIFEQAGVRMDATGEPDAPAPAAPAPGTTGTRTGRPPQPPAGVPPGSMFHPGTGNFWSPDRRNGWDANGRPIYRDGAPVQ